MAESERVPEPTAAGRAAAAALRARVAGDVHASDLQRWLYSTDASGYRVIPDAVLVARSTEDLIVAATVAAEFDVPLCLRGAGTSLAGQAIGPGILVDCFHLDRVLAVDPEARLARVQPGVIQASLNRAAAPYGLEFGPDTSTVDQATIGGMVGNNSSGSRSIVYGESVDKVSRVKAALVGGDVVEFGPCTATNLASGLSGAPAARLADELAKLRDRSGERIAATLPQTRRSTSGYQLRQLLASQPNLAKLLAGSEGTLALFLELEVELDPRPSLRLVAALTFATLRQALEANVGILASGPSAVELLDLAPLRRAPNLKNYRYLAPLLAGDEEAMLTVEYQGSEDEARAGLARLRALAPDLGAHEVRYLAAGDEAAEAGALRRAALPLLMGAPGAERPASFVEDTAVAPEKLAAFVADFQRVVAQHGARASFTGHASAGCLHVRPLLDLKTAAGVGQLAAIAADVGTLVLEYHGAISGEHGCGRSRSWFLPQLFGPEVYAEFVNLKRMFDPSGLLGPGTLVAAPGVTENLRFGADYRAREVWRPRLSYAVDGGFDQAVEKCFGAGLCKKTTGTMCPPAMVDRDETKTTRARANTLQALISGALSSADLGSAELRDVLGSCVACKACKTECPAGVDMATLKVEWLAEVRAREGFPLLARGVGHFRRLAALAAPLAPLVNLLARSPLARLVTDRVGVAHGRPLPRFARRPLTRRLRYLDVAPLHEQRSSTSPPADALPTDVALFVDCFIQYQEPQIGEALARLLAAADVRLHLAETGCCGRTALSTGQIDLARKLAAKAVGGLYEHARAGRTIVFIEPSCQAMAVDDWSRLLPGDARVAAVAAATRSALGLVADLAAAGRLRFAGPAAAVVHPHCHEKALWGSADTERALRSVPGIDLSVLDCGCCGMSGVFGYEAEHFALSQAIAERALLPAVRAAAPDTVVLATGTSCRSQIADLGGRQAQHPLELLARHLVGPPS
jgi:FAD/FMN-containing dehydrogenase/Fe-S oxidoreductase